MNQAVEMASGSTGQDRPLLEVSNLSVQFTAVRAVDNIEITLNRGETLGLVGESGSGKSTAGRAILQITRPTSGSVKFDGVELAGMPEKQMRLFRRRMQMIFQDPRSSLDSKMRVSEIIAEPLEIHNIGTRTEREERVSELLQLVGLSPTVGNRFPHQFSGGQAQRIAIARAIALDPDFLIADEPISALDVSIQAQIVNLLLEIKKSLQLSMIFIAHDLAVVRYISDKIAVMYLGKIVEVADKNHFYGRPLHPYSQALLSAVPVPDPKRERTRSRIVLTGDMPNPETPPSGCRFHTRCPLRAAKQNPAICAEEEPALTSAGPGHVVACHFADL